MKNKIRPSFILKFFLPFGILFWVLSSHAQEDGKGDIPNFKMNGDVALLSNYVEHGLTQTNKDPSLQAAFGFNFGPQFKMGVWGSNVSYENSEEHFLLKLNAELKVLISTNTDFRLAYSNMRYFKPDTRNGNMTSLIVTSYGYRVAYESQSNWEGTDERATHYSLGKAYDVNQKWKWDNEVGYTMLKDLPELENYFDLRTSFLYKGGSNITYQISVTGTSNPGQFEGQGDVFFFVGASTSF